VLAGSPWLQNSSESTEVVKEVIRRGFRPTLTTDKPGWLLRLGEFGGTNTLKELNNESTDMKRANRVLFPLPTSLLNATAQDQIRSFYRHSETIGILHYYASMGRHDIFTYCIEAGVKLDDSFIELSEPLKVRSPSILSFPSLGLILVFVNSLT